MIHIDFVVLPLAYLSALFVGWSLRSFKNEKTEIDLSIQVELLTAQLDNVKTRLQEELAEARAEVERLKMKISLIQSAIDDDTDDEMPELVSADQ